MFLKMHGSRSCLCFSDISDVSDVPIAMIFRFLYFSQLHIFTNLFLALHFLFLSLFLFGKDTFFSSFMNSSNFYGSFHKSSILFFQNLPHLETLDAAVKSSGEICFHGNLTRLQICPLNIFRNNPPQMVPSWI